MRKIFLLFAVILLQSTLLMAQERDNVGHRVGSWSLSRHGCFNGLEWKIRKSYYSDNSDKFTNEIQIKNTYNSPITFSYNMSENSNETTTRYRKTLGKNETYTSTYCPNVNFVTFYVTDVCFNNNNCKDGCYAQCDNGSPNQPNCGNSNSTSSSANSSNTQQNDLSDYNNSKADLERQMNEKNAEIQKQNQEIANRNAEAKRQQELLRQQQEAEKLKAIEQVVGILQDGAVSITKSSLADLQNITLKEEALSKILRGNETKYPEATKYFNEYLREKKKRKTLQWIGLGGVIAGAGVITISLKDVLFTENGTETNDGLFYAGCATTLAGLGITIFSIKPTKKGKEALEKAESNIAIGTTKNGIGLTLNF